MYGLLEFFSFLTYLIMSVFVSLSGSSSGWMQLGRTPADVARVCGKDEAARFLDSWRGPSQVRAIPCQLHPDLSSKNCTPQSVDLT